MKKIPCPSCSTPMTPSSKKCRACYLKHGAPQEQSKPETGGER